MITRLLILLKIMVLFALPVLAQSPSVAVVEGTGRVITLSEEAASVFVGDPGIADVQAVSPRSLYLSGVSPGTTNVLALDFEDRLIAKYQVRVVANNDDEAALLRESSADISVRQSGNTAILRGTANSLDQAIAALETRRALESAGRTAVNRSTLKGGTQISLRVRFVEASRSDLSRLGFDLAALSSGNNPIRVLTGAGIASDFVTGVDGLSDFGLRAGGPWQH